MGTDRFRKTLKKNTYIWHEQTGQELGPTWSFSCPVLYGEKKLNKTLSSDEPPKRHSMTV